MLVTSVSSLDHVWCCLRQGHASPPASSTETLEEEGSSGKATYWNASDWAFAGEAEPPEHCSVTWDVFGWKMSGSVLVWEPFDPSPKTRCSRGPGALPWVTVDTLGSAEQNGLSTSQKVWDPFLGGIVNIKQQSKKDSRLNVSNDYF